MRRLRAGDIGSISAWLPSRRSTAHHSGAVVMLLSGQVRSGTEIGSTSSSNGPVPVDRHGASRAAGSRRAGRRAPGGSGCGSAGAGRAGFVLMIVNSCWPVMASTGGAPNSATGGRSGSDPVAARKQEGERQRHAAQPNHTDRPRTTRAGPARPARGTQIPRTRPSLQGLCGRRTGNPVDMTTRRTLSSRYSVARVIAGIGALFALIEVVYALMLIFGANQANAFFGFIRSSPSRSPCSSPACSTRATTTSR